MLQWLLSLACSQPVYVLLLVFAEKFNYQPALLRCVKTGMARKAGGDQEVDPVDPLGRVRQLPKGRAHGATTTRASTTGRTF